MTAMKTFDYRGSIVLTSGITFLILALVRIPYIAILVITPSWTTVPNTNPVPRRQHPPMAPSPRRLLPLLLSPLRPRLNLARAPPPTTNPATLPLDILPPRQHDHLQFLQRHRHQRRLVQRPYLLPSRVTGISYLFRSSPLSPNHLRHRRRHFHRLLNHLVTPSKVANGPGWLPSFPRPNTSFHYGSFMAYLDQSYVSGAVEYGTGIPVPGDVYWDTGCGGAG